MTPSQEAGTLIVGAGPAGLALAGVLTQRGMPHTLIERGPQVGNSWHQHYRRLHLHTPKGYSALPGMPWPANVPRYPSRQQVVDYLQAYADQHRMKPLLGHEVLAAEQLGDGRWQVTVRTPTGDQRHISGTALVVATGVNGAPVRPEWPGMADYRGQVLHSSEYLDGAPFKGQRLLVVGLGNSGGEICIDLHEHGAQPTVVIRNAVNIIPKEVLGISYLTTAMQQQRWPTWLADAINAPLAKLLIGDLRPHGVCRLPYGPAAQVRQTGKVPLIDIGTVKLIKGGQLAVRPGIERFTADGVRFVDGRQEAFDAVVLATGYRPQIANWLKTPHGSLDEQGDPKVGSGPALDTGVPGLYYLGYWVSPTGMFRQFALDAPKLADLLQARQ